MPETPKLCECGCGIPAPIATRNRKAIGHVKGQPIRFVQGHAARHMITEARKHIADELAMIDLSEALCRCGCGLQTPVAKQTFRARGYVKGQPQKFIRGHASRKCRHPCGADLCETLTTRTYCQKHETRMQRHGNLVGERPHGDAVSRFWARVQKSDGCWLWEGARSDVNYGLHWTDEKRLEGAHRFSYRLHHGDIPSGLMVCHHCDNPPCVNPEHLFMGTVLDNMRDMIRKGRGAHQRNFVATILSARARMIDQGEDEGAFTG